MDIADVFDQVANQMRADFERARSAIQHPGIKGHALEETFRRFLRDHLPGSLDVATGMIVDSYGRMSKQLDVVISDAARTPVLYREGDIRVIPVECAFAVIEVKAHLDGAALQHVFANMKSVYDLEPIEPLKKIKVDEVPESGGGGQLLFTVQEAPYLMKGVRSLYYPINYFVFAYESIDLRTISDHMFTHRKENLATTHKWLDMVCVLNRGLICNRTPEKQFDALPTAQWHLVDSSVSRPLVAFYALMTQYLLQASAPKFDLGHYFKYIDFNPARE